TETETERLLVEWNGAKVEYPAPHLLPALFEAQVERTLESVALIFEDAQLTYHELNHRANQLAAHLRRLGVGPESLVGVCMERSLEMMVGILGVLKAGGAYVPLDPAYPPERLSFMLDDSKVPILLTHARLKDRLPACDARLICLDADWPQIARRESANLVNGAQPENLAYVIYTSGSTG